MPRSFFVNPIAGKDTNAGTKLLPFKTLARALSSAIAKDTVRLASGVYSATTNGERFTTTLGQLVRVPAGVMILGTLSGGDVTSQLRGSAGETGLNLQGAVTVRNVALGGFNTGIRATQGVQSFKNVALDQNVVGIELSGSAQATLLLSLVLLTPPPIRVDEESMVGANLTQQAQLTLVSSSIGNSSQNCRNVKGVSLQGAARADPEERCRSQGTLPGQRWRCPAPPRRR